MRLLPILLASAAIAAPALADQAEVERTYLERAAIASADESCHLFSSGERLALMSGLYQARGELLRAGRPPAQIDRLTNDVRAHARSLGCEHPEVRSVAATVRDSYRQFQKTGYMEYPGVHMVWGASRSEFDKWVVSQADKASGVTFGLHRGEKPDQLRLALSIPAEGDRPASARIFIRDPDRLGEPWLGSLFGPTKAPSPPARSLTRPEWASEMRSEKETKNDRRLVIYFPDEAIRRLGELDPREAIEIEVAPSPLDRDAKPRRYVFELGDFNAATAFAAIPTPQEPSAPAAPPKAGAH